MICDMNRNGSTKGAWAVAIKDETPTQVFCDNDYCSWGVDGAGNHYFCSWDNFDGDLTHVRLIGTENVDNLYFWYDHPQYDTQDLDAWGSSDLYGQMYGNEEEDCLDGSARDTCEYYEELYGDDGGDIIVGRGGMHDTVYAGGGNDTVTTGSGDDTVFLGGGDDYCVSGAGNDTVNGGSDQDAICSGVGDDIVDAGSGHDWVNAEGNSSVGDYVDGALGYDTCDGDEFGSGCDVPGTLTCP